MSSTIYLSSGSSLTSKSFRLRWLGALPLRSTANLCNVSKPKIAWEGFLRFCFGGFRWQTLTNKEIFKWVHTLWGIVHRKMSLIEWGLLMVIHPVVFIKRPSVYNCDYMINVTYKIRFKYADFDFSKMFYRISKQKFPWRKSFLSSKKATQALKVQ